MTDADRSQATMEGRLPALVDNLFAAYDLLADKDEFGDPKDISAHHAARRAALLHLQALLRVRDMVIGRTRRSEDDSDDPKWREWRKRARAEIDNVPEDE